jgi:hypothetical protein
LFSSLLCYSLLYFVNPRNLHKCLTVPCGDFEEKGSDKRGGDFSPRYKDNSDEESQTCDKFHCTSATTNTKRSVFTMKAMYLSTGTGGRARGSIVVKALCCKLEGRGFASRGGEFLN